MIVGLGEKLKWVKANLYVYFGAVKEASCLGVVTVAVRRKASVAVVSVIRPK